MITFEINKSKKREEKKIKNQKQQKQLGTVICPFADIICATNCTFITWDSLLFIGEYGAVCFVVVVFFLFFARFSPLHILRKGSMSILCIEKPAKLCNGKSFACGFK